VDTHRNVPNPHHHTTRFHRGHLHAALLEHVPRQSIHLSKKLLHADTDGNGVVLHFEDGTTAHGDILIGADGLKSVCRLPLDRSMQDELVTQALLTEVESPASRARSL
jgi:salicylate hydroxylase